MKKLTSQQKLDRNVVVTLFIGMCAVGVSLITHTNWAGAHTSEIEYMVTGLLYVPIIFCILIAMFMIMGWEVSEPLKGKITPEQLHKWYLEAIKIIEPDSYNKDAVKPFDKLTEKQQAIDIFIAGKIHEEKEL